MILHDIALSIIPEVGIARAHRLIECFGDAETALNTSREQLVEIAQFAPDTATKIAARFKHNDIYIAADKEIKFLDKVGARAIAFSDADYPALLRECPDAPLVLYCKGELDLNSPHMISMVGTRKITDYGVKMCEKIVAEIAEAVPDAVIVSGLAYGVDIECERAAARHRLKTLTVVANNLRNITPTAHHEILRNLIADGGAVVTEMCSWYPTLKSSFLQRNRIIAGLSMGTVIVESPFKSGSMSTARCAREYNRETMAVPGRIVDPTFTGNNDLIRTNRASLVTSGFDVTDILGWKVANRTSREPALFDLPDFKLSPDEQRFYDQLGTSVPIPLDTIAQRLGEPIQVVNCLAIGLELKGAVRVMPGNQYLKS